MIWYGMHRHTFRNVSGNKCTPPFGCRHRAIVNHSSIKTFYTIVKIIKNSYWLIGFSYARVSYAVLVRCTTFPYHIYVMFVGCRKTYDVMHSAPINYPHINRYALQISIIPYFTIYGVYGNFFFVGSPRIETERSEIDVRGNRNARARNRGNAGTR